MMEPGDFVKSKTGRFDEGRILAVANGDCLVYTANGIFRVAKNTLKVTLQVRDHLNAIAEELEKESGD